LDISNHKKIRAQHLHRLRKIENRKPGTSHTLDNGPPEVLQPKAFAGTYGHVRNELIFNENKALLKRISLILTSKGEDVEKDYLELKKHYIPKCKSKKLLFEKALVEKRIKKFFQHIKYVKPYYKVKNWESDYQKQAFNQKFMRQVNYKRPPGFVDPFAMRPVAEEVKLPPKKPHVSYAHVNRIRLVKQMSASRSTVSANREGRSNEGSVTSPSNQRRGKSDNEYYDFENDVFEDDDTSDERKGSFRVKSYLNDSQSDEYENDDDEEEGSADHVRVELVTTRRKVRVVEDFEPEDGETKSNSVYFLDATVQCYMMDKTDVVISIETIPDDVKTTPITCDAEIDLQDLSAIRSGVGAEMNSDTSVESASNAYALADDLPALTALAQDIVTFVEMKIDLNGSARVVLHLAHQFDTDSQSITSTSDINSLGGTSRKDDFTDGGGGTMSASAAARARVEELGMMDGDNKEKKRSSPLPHTASLPSMTHSLMMPRDGEIDGMLLEDSDLTVLSKGMLLPVFFVFNEEIASKVTMVEFMRRPNKAEYLYALIKVQTNLSDDQLTVSALFCSSSKFMVSIHRGSRATVRRGKIKPAVEAGVIAVAQTSMPSIIYADPDMIHTFAQNVTQQLKVEHDCITGENVLVLQT